VQLIFCGHHGSGVWNDGSGGSGDGFCDHHDGSGVWNGDSDGDSGDSGDSGAIYDHHGSDESGDSDAIYGHRGSGESGDSDESDDSDAICDHQLKHECVWNEFYGFFFLMPFYKYKLDNYFRVVNLIREHNN
jgi:hypothetical protein